MNFILTDDCAGNYVLSVANKRIADKLKRDGLEYDKYFQVDYDFPDLARTLGWNGKIGRERCRHSGTDGTVKCPDCGRTAGEFISAAQAWLDRHNGCVFRNKGQEYFDN
jgi:hypothetical protein